MGPWLYIGENWAQDALLPLHVLVFLTMLLMLGEGIGYLIGHRPSRYVHHVMPDWIEPVPVAQLRVSRFLVVLFFLINFSLSGYILECIVYAIQGSIWPFMGIAGPALVMAWGLTHFLVNALNQRIRPYRRQRQHDLIGRLGTIVSGHAKPGSTAQAAVRDAFGQLHYVAVESEFGELELQCQIILVAQNNGAYIAKKITPLQPIDG